jgi:uncharacterized UPF0160 family protein
MSKTIVAVTHNGRFHTDDVFAAATLELFYADKDLKIIRSRDEKDIASADIVFDVGGIYDSKTLRFDHHQKGGAGERENGIPYASFGLVWKEYGVTLCESKEVALYIEEKLVTPIDASDNGVDIVEPKNGIFPYTISSMISAFKPTWEEDALTMHDENFFKMVAWAKEIITREIIKVNSFIKAQALVEEAYKKAIDKRIILLNGLYPADEILNHYPEPLYMVAPRDDGKWGVKCVSLEGHGFANRKDLPSIWGGLRDIELQELTGVSDAMFCHRSLYLAVAGSREGALELAHLAVEY